jgi:DNA-binding transcriptional ArsR family regulator
VPSLFAHQPAPPVSAAEPPMLAYPSRGAATLWEPEPAPDVPALTALPGAPRTTLLRLLAEPLPTVEPARRLGVTPSAVSRHLRVLHATGLVTRARDGRRVLYRRGPLGERLAAHDGAWPVPQRRAVAAAGRLRETTRVPPPSTTRTCSEPHPQRVHSVRPVAVVCRDSTRNGSPPSGHPQCGQAVAPVLDMTDSSYVGAVRPSRHSQGASRAPYTSRLTLWTSL